MTWWGETARITVLGLIVSLLIWFAFFALGFLAWHSWRMFGGLW